MTHFPHGNAVNLQEIETRNSNARRIIAGFARALPTLTEIWHYLDVALADMPRLSAEIRRQRASIARIRLDRANLRAAIRATLAAHREGERDPLAYLRDELDGPVGRPSGRGRRR